MANYSRKPAKTVISAHGAYIRACAKIIVWFTRLVATRVANNLAKIYSEFLVFLMATASGSCTWPWILDLSLIGQFFPNKRI